MTAPRVACVGPVLLTFAGMAVLFYVAGRNYYNLYTENSVRGALDRNNTIHRRELSADKLWNHKVKSSRIGLCRSRECHEVAEYIKKSLNNSAEPCHDFYNFACGNWKKHNPLPKSYNDYNTFSKLSHHIETQLRDLLQKKLKLDSRTLEHSSIMKAKDFYKSCMDVDELEKLGALPMLNFIKSIGSWAVAGRKSWSKHRWDIYKVMKHIQKLYYPASPFFSVEVTNDHLNSTKHLIKVKNKYHY